MKKIIILAMAAVLLLTVSACSGGDTVEVESTIVEKVVVDGDRYQFKVTYSLEGNPGYEATISVNKRTWDRYNVGDIYKFKRPR